jgi:hypothetical protein
MKFIGRLLLSDGPEDEFYIIVKEISCSFSPKAATPIDPSDSKASVVSKFSTHVLFHIA